MMFLRVLLLAVFGPTLALIATWQAPIGIARISAEMAPTAEIVERLRTVPADSVLEEMREVAVSYPRFYGLAPEKIVGIADKMLHHKYVIDGIDHGVGVPFEPNEYVFGHSTRQLDLNSFLVPSALGRAYEISGEGKYIEAAVQYILDWAKYETSLLVPRGLIFNDHAMAARSIVVTEIWRLYRDSTVYRADAAMYLIKYVQKLSRLLLEERLYEYRTNHGLMQSLSLLHLAIAYPLLEVSGESRQVGKRRLLSQLAYYVNDEGVILEHSPGYHQHGLGRLAAAGRYLGLLGEAVPGGFVDRYHKALNFLRALRRPDRTLPPIGDTVERPLGFIQIASFDKNVASEPLHEESAAAMPAPSRLTAAPGAGWIILWDGLPHWPDASKLTQTVFHWGNFPTGVHKHSDDLGISIWSHGYQWVRSVGYWPYIASRAEAIRWRSSNGPHWLNEPPLSDRSSSLTGSAVEHELAFFDVLRTNADGSHIRRQLVKLAGDTWIVLDSFKSQAPKTAEVVWRFPPGITIEVAGQGGVVLNSVDAGRNLTLRVAGSRPVRSEADCSGTAGWNSGMLVDGRIASSPAIRLSSLAEDPVIVTFFRLHDAEKEPMVIGEEIGMDWEDDAKWEFSFSGDKDGLTTVKRDSNVINVVNNESTKRSTKITTSLAESAIAPRQSALGALNWAYENYGMPFQPMIERRIKVTLAVLATAIVQLGMFLLVKARHQRWWPAVGISSCIAWITLSLYIGLSYLA